MADDAKKPELNPILKDVMAKEGMKLAGSMIGGSPLSALLGAVGAAQADDVAKMLFNKPKAPALGAVTGAAASAEDKMIQKFQQEKAREERREKMQQERENPKKPAPMEQNPDLKESLDNLKDAPFDKLREERRKGLQKERERKDGPNQDLASNVVDTNEIAPPMGPKKGGTHQI